MCCPGKSRGCSVTLLRLPSFGVVPFSHGIKPARLLISTTHAPSFLREISLVQFFCRAASSITTSPFLPSAQQTINPSAPKHTTITNALLNSVNCSSRIASFASPVNDLRFLITSQQPIQDAWFHYFRCALCAHHGVCPQRHCVHH